MSKKDNKKPPSSNNTKNNTNTDTNDVIVFEDKEKDLLKETADRIGIDLENDSDLLSSPSSMPEDFKPEDIDKIMEDKNNKTLIRDLGNNPNLFDTVSQNDKKGNPTQGNLTAADIQNIRDEKETRRNELILQLANADSMKMHLVIGMKDGKNVWLEKEFYFISYEQRQRFALSLLLARVDSIGKKYTLLNYKPMNTLTESEQNFLMHGRMMGEVAGYRYQEFEFKLKFNMSPEDYARIPMDELDLAREVYDEHIRFDPFLQSKAIILFFQGWSWNELKPSDFLVIYPNKKFNTLKKKVTCFEERLPQIMNKANEFITMYINYKVHEIKPWQLREGNKILAEDLRALEILAEIDHDVKEQKRRAEEQKRKLEEQNKQQQQQTAQKQQY